MLGRRSPPCQPSQKRLSCIALLCCEPAWLGPSFLLSFLSLLFPKPLLVPTMCWACVVQDEYEKEELRTSWARLTPALWPGHCCGQFCSVPKRRVGGGGGITETRVSRVCLCRPYPPVECAVTASDAGLLCVWRWSRGRLSQRPACSTRGGRQRFARRGVRGVLWRDGWLGCQGLPVASHICVGSGRKGGVSGCVEMGMLRCAVP